MRKILGAVVLMAVALSVSAQSTTNSPYSQYGFGTLSEQSAGFSRGMNGLSVGFREHNQVNYMNPASYASIDSLSFIFDAGLSLQLTNFKENGRKLNAKNGSFDYVVAGFRAARHVGVSFGVLPFANVGYDYSNTSPVNVDENGDRTTSITAYNGTGGLRQVYLGAGWEPFKGVAFGANVGYLWGNTSRSVVNSYSDAYVNTLGKYYSLSVKSYNVNAGVQLTLPLSKKDQVTLGATYTLGHSLKADAECLIISTNSQTKVADTTATRLNNVLDMPTMISAGLMYNHDNKLKIGADFTLQKWGSTSFPVYSGDGLTAKYALSDNAFMDRKKLTVGGMYCENERSRSFFKRIQYRVGASYATPYIKINGLDGPKEMSVSAGFGIPIINRWNNRSVLNISGQWVRQEAKNMITENTFRINVGLTFNERWFEKWKVN